MDGVGHVVREETDEPGEAEHAHEHEPVVHGEEHGWVLGVGDWCWSVTAGWGWVNQ